ncbi:MAG: TIGR00725 family protein [Nitrosopumilaceae archaeon]|nr:TIGR00725 family protein [Nitrosopumilaceae archaeon]NIU00617.1 TIGR00725 family protein [Nitrosopumilaceae archaeon]NIU87003.1 TIGR00725 family protein [Nitrosopumilaceae archaeon]NIV66467.1 TIGR00725 family protein [Nitrosopumilaceae archaeon]NIX61219.1 TIGR00725 family protein [Nitrosopumilaceae archaeon]
MTRLRQILVIGHNESGCTPEHEKIAYETGAQIASSDCVLITGGLGGVMRAASKGAKEAGGLTVGIIPQNDPSFANEFCDIVIPSGLGLSRDFLNALSADGVIIIGGGSGTLSEMCAAYMYKKPMVAIKNIGGTAEPYIDSYIDYRNNVKVIGVDNPKKAVQTILELITTKI